MQMPVAIRAIHTVPAAHIPASSARPRTTGSAATPGAPRPAPDAAHSRSEPFAIARLDLAASIEHTSGNAREREERSVAELQACPLRAFRRSSPRRYARRVARIRVQRPQSVSDVMRPLLETALITFIALKLAGVVTWSWWWVLSPLWISAAPLVLLAGGFLALWCLGRLSFSLVNPFHWRRRRQARLFFRWVASTNSPFSDDDPA
jgi:hypothetical protein